MHLTSREAQLIRLLLNDSQSLKQMSEKFKISTKTLHGDIRNINIKLSSFDTEIEIYGNIVQFNSIYSNVHWLNLLSLNMVIEEEDLMILKLLFKKDYVLLIDFAQELYMSKSKLEKMLACSQILNEYIIKKRNLGVKVDLDNIDKLNLSIAILMPYVDDLNYLVTARSLVQQLTEQKITIKEFRKSIDYFNLQIERLVQISDNECKILILFVLLAEHLLDLTTTEMDLIIDNFINPDESNEKIVRTIATEINLIMKQNNIVVQSEQILTALVNHVYNAINKATTNTIDVAMELRLKNEYSYAYSIADEMYIRLNRLLHVNMPSYERNYLTMYIQSFLNNAPYQQKLNILIVCQYGLSVSNYIQVWLEQNVDFDCHFTISSVLNYWHLGDKLEQYDLIITTVNNLEAIDQKIVQLKTIPLESEMQELKQEIIRFHFQKEAESFFSCNSLKQIAIMEIDEVYPLIEAELCCKSRTFINLMKERTNTGLTIVNGVIIMHSDGSLLSENRLIIYKLQEPIIYDQQEVKMIFVFAFTQEFLEMFNHVIKEIYRVIYSKNYVSALYETSTDKQFMWIFKSQIKGGNYDNK